MSLAKIVDVVDKFAEGISDVVIDAAPGKEIPASESHFVSRKNEQSSSSVQLQKSQGRLRERKIPELESCLIMGLKPGLSTHQREGDTPDDTLQEISMNRLFWI